MASIVWADVVAFAPTLSTVDAGAQADVLGYVNIVLAVAQFDGEDGPTTRLARIYLAAHMGSLGVAAASGSAGPVVSRSIGGISEDYADTSSSSGSALGDTSFGELYLQLVRRSPARATVVL